MAWNIFRILGDLSHTLSKCILIYSIHRNSSAEGVSLITQSLYTLVFCSRYLDLFRPRIILWNFVLKIFYIASSLYIVFLMLRVYARTREREKAWKFGAACLFGSAIVAPFVMMIFQATRWWGFMEVLWNFSIVLESVAILPQLLLLRQTTVPTVLTSQYLLTLGLYRAFYILNWVWRELEISPNKPDAVSIIFGIIQTAFYVDFAWVYYSRQRVKLRNGGVVDEQDLGRGWLLSKVFGQKGLVETDAEDEESSPALGPGNGNGNVNGSAPGKWGARGISVSADDPSLEASRANGLGEFEDDDDDQITGITDGADDAKMRDPDELARILDEDEDDDNDGVLAPPAENVGNGAEWRG